MTLSAMQLPIVRIGNSQGIRLSKSLLERYQLGREVEVELRDDCIVLKPIQAPRQGWDEAFAQMANEGDDALRLPDVFEDESNLIDELYGDTILLV